MDRDGYRMRKFTGDIGWGGGSEKWHTDEDMG
jgi:hypothetical protein